MVRTKGVDLNVKTYMSGHNLVITIPKDVAEELGIKPGDRIRVKIDRTR